MKNNEEFYPHGNLTDGVWDVAVGPKDDGSWKYTGVRTANLSVGVEAFLPASNLERVIVPLYGKGFTVDYTANGESGEQALRGRQSVFHGTPDTLYLPVGASAVITGEGRIAVAEAPAGNIKPVQFIPMEDTAIELRGAGQSSRQVHNFGTPANLDADRIIVCEVITPSENWSSYPPHKHDEFHEGQESNLEEIYYFETAVSRNLGKHAPSEIDAIGYMRNYKHDGEREIETFAEVRSGDVALVPFGWHGPCVAAPGYDLYYLNVMAGPDPDRSWNIVDDPHHGWIRKSWEEQQVDPRLPFKA